MKSTTAQDTGVHRTAILVIVLVTYFMIILDASIVFTGLPSIESSMDFSASGLSWVQDAYTLTFGGLLLLGARAGDIAGRRRTFLIGLVIFTVASVFVGAAQTPMWLIGARGLQGIGAAILAPSSLSLISATFPEGKERSHAVALYAAVAGIGASLGMVLGGLFAELISWRAGFYINLPVGIVMLILGLRFLRETPHDAGRFDLIGAICSTVGVGALVFGIINSADIGWDSAETIISLLVGIILLVTLVLHESRAQQPIMPLQLFRSPVRSGAYAVRFLYLGAMIGFFFFTTQFTQGVLGFTPLQTGLAFLPMTAVNFAVAMLVPKLIRRVPSAAILAAGVLATLAGMLWLSRVTVDSTYLLDVALPMVLIGLGQGLAFAPLTSFGINGVRPELAGAASGLLNTAHQLGTCVGLAVLVTVSTALAGNADTAAALTQRVHVALIGSSVMLIAAAIVVVAIMIPAVAAVGPRRRTRAAADADDPALTASR